ncbi:MAG: hypothetical protein QOE50_425 [Sphingomonadales bacterium]|jgi:hypothetical protein|nr:hypothetical protein [Sphingomonadales bacterium]
MKLLIVFAVFIWLLCGVAGAWWDEGLGNMHFKTIAKGPISLVHAINDNPVTYPGPN